MEWVRACCISKWRLTRGSPRLRAGFYWFCGEDTPFYPGRHNLGSRDWTSDERNPEPELGEWSGERIWRRGDPPARRPIPVIVGSPDCIANGEEPGLAIVHDVDADCGQILPSPCYAVEELIFSKTNVFDCVFGHLSARVIDKSYTDLPAAAAIVAGYMPFGTVVSTFPQPSPLIPAGVVATVSDTVVLWLTGTANFQQLAAQGLYFGLGPVDQGLYSASVLYEDTAMAIAAILNTHGAGTAERVVLCGHSYGGAVCMVLAARMVTANVNANVEILTLGAPAPGDDRLHRLIELLAQRHYANELDPIPYLPPGAFQFPWLLPVLGALLVAQWAKFERAPHVKKITQDGEFVDVHADDLPDDLITLAAGFIAVGADTPNFKDHRTDWYIYYLCLACKCISRPCPRPDPAQLGFDFILDGLRWLHGGVETVENFAANLTYEALFDHWVFNELPNGRVVIIPFYDAVGNYETFRVEYSIASEGPLDVPFVWTFPAAEMLVGIDTTSEPSFDPADPADRVLGMGRLVIPSLYLYPPIDGLDDGGFIPIFDGNGLP